MTTETAKKSNAITARYNGKGEDRHELPLPDDTRIRFEFGSNEIEVLVENGKLVIRSDTWLDLQLKAANKFTVSPTPEGK